LSQLEHPCLVKPVARGYDQAHQAPYVVHESIKGSPLSELIRSPTLTFYLRLRILTELASALAVLHGRQICHRALKPENVIIDHHWHARLIDFGLASTPVSQIDRKSLAHRLSYHPPECLAGHTVPAAADVYALGVLAYVLFAGYNPFAAATVEGVKLAMRNLVPPELCVVVSGFPADLSRELALALDKEIDARPTSIELSMQLRSIQDRTDPEQNLSLPAYRMATLLE
jgi:eukaryotic-like serine/threonine-protein kinase